MKRKYPFFKNIDFRFLHLLIVLCFLLFTSCKYTQPPSFLETIKKDTILQKYSAQTEEMKIKKFDILGITINSLNKELDAKFNTIVTPSTGNTGAVVQDPGYNVDEKGYINIHYLGSIKAEGLSRHQLKLALEKGLEPYLKEPIANVKFLNKKITVMGAVQKSQVLYMPEEQISLIDAIAMSGDLAKTADLNQVIIMRDSSGKKIIKQFNLHSADFIKSSWYYLQPDDIVYIKNDNSDKVKEERQRRMQINISILSTTISLIVLLVTIFKK